MYNIEDIINTIICGHSLEVLRQIPPESVHLCMTSPPYWGKRSYKTHPLIWDGKPDCEHDFSIETEAGDIRFRSGYSSAVVRDRTPQYYEGDGKGYICSTCGAWMGELGHEPTPEFFISHLCNIFDEVKRVLRKDGTCFVNIGDSYWGSGGSIGHTPETTNFGRKTFDYGAFPTGTIAQKEHKFLQAKSMCCIPEMFVIEMLKRGWILRSKIIWHKPNCVPESADDRFTNDFKHIFFFTKNNDTLYWTNERTLKLVTRAPRTSIEGIDWEWRRCPKCSKVMSRNGANTGINNKSPYEQNNPHRERLELDFDGEQFTLDEFFEEGEVVEQAERKGLKMQKQICRKCQGTGKVKYSLWTGHDYYFQQQFEPYKLNRWGGKYKTNENVKTAPQEKQCGGQGSLNRMGYDCYPNPFGRNMRTTWTIKTGAFKGAHFAVYPEELCLTPILAGCPEFVCKSCGMPRVKILKPTGNYIVYGGYGSKTAEHLGVSPTSSILTKSVQEKAIAGYSDCGCDSFYCTNCKRYLTLESIEQRDALQRSREEKEVQRRLGKKQISEDERSGEFNSRDSKLQGENVSNLWREILREESTRDLLKEVWGSITNEKGNASQLQGLSVNRREESSMERGETEDESRLHNNSQSGAPECDKGRVCDGTQADNGAALRKILESLGSGSSQKRNKRRQQDGELGVSVTQQPQWRGNVPSLPEMVQSSLVCPFCLSQEIILKHSDHEPGIVLDPFAGSGTSAIVALKLNRRFIGIDSNPEYVEMATGRIKPFLEQKKVEVFA